VDLAASQPPAGLTPWRSFRLPTRQLAGPWPRAPVAASRGGRAAGLLRRILCSVGLVHGAGWDLVHSVPLRCPAVLLFYLSLYTL